MPFFLRTACRRLLLSSAIALTALSALAENPNPNGNRKTVGAVDQAGDAGQQPSLAELKAAGRERSRFTDPNAQSVPPDESTSNAEARQPDLARFESVIKPLLEQNCVDCHGSDVSEGNLRVDTLDPDLLTGSDTDWWEEVFAVITKGEMPPPDAGELADDEQRQLVDWLSAELQAASIARRRSGSHSTFRRMTRYEYNYALQDLLGLPWDFARDLPPEAQTEEGFENSSDSLHLSVSQFETYHRIARTALDRATVAGTQPPTRYWGIAMKDAAQREWSKQDEQIAKLEKELKDDPTKLTAELEQLRKRFREPPRAAYYKELSSNRIAPAEWQYYNAQYAFAPQDQPVAFPDDYDCVAILPDGRGSRLIVELGNQLPDEGTMRVTVRASRVNTNDDYFPSL